MKKVLLAAVAATALAISAGAASAHDDYYSYFRNRLENREHQRFHEEFGEAHEEAHEQGFRNAREHRDWHRAYGETHEMFHDEHPRARDYDDDDDDGVRSYRYRPGYYSNPGYYDRGGYYSYAAPAFGFSWNWNR